MLFIKTKCPFVNSPSYGQNVQISTVAFHFHLTPKQRYQMQGQQKFYKTENILNQSHNGEPAADYFVRQEDLMSGWPSIDYQAARHQTASAYCRRGIVPVVHH